MYKAYKFRLYPNQKQTILIYKTFGCYRFIYNYFLEKSKKNKYTSAFKMCNELKELYINYPWLKEVDSSSLRCAIFNLEDAYNNFFAKRGEYPKFKNKYTRQSYQTTCIRSNCKGKEYSNIELNLQNKQIKLPKLGIINIRGYRNLKEIKGRIINATISKEPTGKYYVSVVVKEINKTTEKTVPKNIVGIDLGIKDLVITSNGEKFTNQNYLKAKEKRLKRLQRKLSRQIKGSKNYLQTKTKIARLHTKIKNSRKNYQYEIVNKIANENDIIVSEKLNVKGMQQNHHIAKSLIETSFHQIISLLKWKCEEKGKYFYQVNTFYPSSKICNRCGEKTEITNDLKVREWQCSKCGEKHDRDINASINIMYEGIRLHYGN